MGDDREFKIKITTVSGGSGAQDTSREMGKLKEAGVEANKEIAKATEDLIVKKHDLKSMVKGVKEEFPGLSHVAKLALNPIAFATAAITAAWTIWTERIREATRLLAGVQLPDLTPLDPGRINETAEAWRNYAAAIRQASEAYRSVNQESTRRGQQIDREEQQVHRMLEAQHALEISQLEARRSTMSPAQYQSERRAIDSRFSAAGFHMSERAEAERLNELTQREAELRASAERKQAEAAGIHVMGTADEATQEAAYRRNREEAMKQRAEAQGRLGELLSYRAGEGSWRERRLYELNYLRRYDVTSPDQAEAAERLYIGSANQVIGTSDTWLRGKAERDAARARRTQLLNQATAEGAEAATLRQSIPDQTSIFQNNQRVNASVQGMSALSAEYSGLAEARGHQAEISSGIEAAIRSGNAVFATQLQLLRQWVEAAQGYERRIRSLEGWRRGNGTIE